MALMIKFLTIVFFCGAIANGTTAFAESPAVEFEADELPAESVVPLLDSNMAVKNKSINLRQRLELGLNYGFIIDEMFFNNNLFGLQIYYNVNEEQSFGLKYASRMSGMSDYSQEFTTRDIYINRSPSPSSILAGIYRWSFLYGKMSLAKDMVIPTLFSAETELGVNKIGTQVLPYSSVGITQKFYMKKTYGLGITYRILVYQTIDPVSTYVGNFPSPNYPAESDFDKKIQVSQSLELGLSYLF